MVGSQASMDDPGMSGVTRESADILIHGYSSISLASLDILGGQGTVDGLWLDHILEKLFLFY